MNFADLLKKKQKEKISNESVSIQQIQNNELLINQKNDQLNKQIKTTLIGNSNCDSHFLLFKNNFEMCQKSSKIEKSSNEEKENALEFNSKSKSINREIPPNSSVKQKIVSLQSNQLNQQTFQANYQLYNPFYVSNSNLDAQSYFPNDNITNIYLHADQLKDLKKYHRLFKYKETKQYYLESDSQIKFLDQVVDDLTHNSLEPQNEQLNKQKNAQLTPFLVNRLLFIWKFSVAQQRNEEVFAKPHKFKPLKENVLIKRPTYPELLALRNETFDRVQEDEGDTQGIKIIDNMIHPDCLILLEELSFYQQKIKSPFLPQEIQIQHFNQFNLIKHGKFGKIYQATLKNNGRSVVLKFINASKVLENKLVESLRGYFEFVIKYQLSLVSYQFLELQGFFFMGNNLILILEVGGPDLHTFLQTNNQMTQSGLFILGHDILEGLCLLKKEKQFHGELCPENIIEVNGSFKLTDNGWASGVSGKNRRKDPFTILQYTSPEELKRIKQTFQSDVWKFGVLLYESYLGKKLFDSENQFKQKKLMMKNIKEKSKDTLLGDLRKVIFDLILLENPKKRITAEELLMEYFRITLY